MNKKIKKYLKNLGLDTKLYDGYFVTDTRIVAKVDRTIVHIALNFKGYRAYALNDKSPIFIKNCGKLFEGKINIGDCY